MPIFGLRAHSERGAVTFAVRVQPRASKTEVAGLMDGALKIRLQAPAVEDRANEALSAFLAELLKRPKSAVRILSAHRTPPTRLDTSPESARDVYAPFLL